MCVVCARSLAVGLRDVRGRRRLLDVEVVAELLPESGLETGVAIEDEDLWKAVVANEAVGQ